MKLKENLLETGHLENYEGDNTGRGWEKIFMGLDMLLASMDCFTSHIPYLTIPQSGLNDTLSIAVVVVVSTDK